MESTGDLRRAPPRGRGSLARQAGAAFLVAALLGCTTPRSTPREEARDAALEAAPPGSDGSVDSAAGPDGAAPPGKFRESVRRGRWDEAERALSALPDPEKSSPELRYVRARVAIARADHKLAVELLARLEEALPLLESNIRRHRAEAALHAGPHDVAGDMYSAEGTPQSLLAAAQAFERGANPSRARTACERVIGHPRRTRDLEAQARKLRLTLPGGDARTERDDARWLAIHALSEKDAEAAHERLSRVAKDAPLRGGELLLRAHELAEAGATDEALRAVERAASAREKAPPIDLCRGRAEALYKSRSRYSEAALAYSSCERKGGPRAAEDAFLAARSLSRADRDPEALVAMKAVIDRYPGTPFSAQAAFHVARIHALHGDWARAMAAFDELATKKGAAGGNEREAGRYRALTHLAAHDFAGARRLFEVLAEDAEDALVRARYTNLAALASARDGDRTHALARWREVIRSAPLSMPALVARARIKEAHSEPPPVIAPAEAGDAGPPLAISLPPPVAMLHALGLDDEAEEALRSRESLVEGLAPGRGVEALCAAYGMLGRAKRRYQIAARVPASLLASTPSARNRWAWDCAYPRPYEGEVREAEGAQKLPPGLVHAVMRQESAFDPDVVSPARAVGLLQLLPETARAVAKGASLAHEDGWLVRPSQNVALGARYLHDLGEKFDGDPLLVAGAYNAGPEAMSRWESRAKGLDVEIFVERIPYVETRGYVVRVTSNLARYGLLARGEDGVPKIKLTM